ncbi:uridine kinase [Planosporangium mesophilum]|uniref:Uridine kinase n=1 Tax=Planosporangium mesophilum TaxID=689768 RepID=A0A8J3TI11_9ACTN|nr:uridine kinase [Planosporangium mesophilum]NJC82678.1 uridine kinase [Planosporangium mesophilum]GII21825.1 uridine kinase [Planosporangium mesophilum]
MPVRPVSPGILVEELADIVAGAPSGRWLRVGVDGPPPAGPHDLADALVTPLRVRGRPVQRVRADDFLRPASLRLERGRTDPDAFYEDWLDVRGLTREVLDPLGSAGTGRILPTLWDADRDRATRAGYVTVPDSGVLLLSGALLLGTGLPLDLVVHLEMSPAALARRTVEADRWTLPAYRRYADEVDPPMLADVVVRVDDPRHPALVA